MRTHNNKKVHGKRVARKMMVMVTPDMEALNVFVLCCSGREGWEGMMMMTKIWVAITMLMAVHHTTKSHRIEGRKRWLWGGSGQQLWEDEGWGGGIRWHPKVEEWRWHDAVVSWCSGGKWWVTKLWCDDGRSNNIGGDGGCRDGGGGEEENYVSEVVVDEKKEEEEKEEEEMNKLWHKRQQCRSHGGQDGMILSATIIRKAPEKS